MAFSVSPFSAAPFAALGNVSVTVEPGGVSASALLDDETLTAEAVIDGTINTLEAVASTTLANESISAEGTYTEADGFALAVTLENATIEAIADVTVATGLSATATLDSNTLTVIAPATVTMTGFEVSATLASVDQTFSSVSGAQLSTTQKKFGSASLYLSGGQTNVDDGAYISADFPVDASTGDFTLDMWILPSVVAESSFRNLFSIGSTNSATSEWGYLTRITSTGQWRVIWYEGLTSEIAVIKTFTTSEWADNTWVHLSLERAGDVRRVYCNGTVHSAFPNSSSFRPSATGTFVLGNNFGANTPQSFEFDGYFDEVRFSHTARYNGTSFTAPTSAYTVDADTSFLLHFDGADGYTTIRNEVGVATAEAGDVVDGVGATATVADTVTVVTLQDVDVDGVSATATLADETVSAFATTGVLTGVSTSVLLEDESLTAEATVVEQGLGATITLSNDVLVSIPIDVDVTGVSATATLDSNTLTVTAEAGDVVSGQVLGASEHFNNTFSLINTTNAKLKTSQKKFGTASLFLDPGADFTNDGGYLIADFPVDVSTGDYTLDMWIWIPADDPLSNNSNYVKLFQLGGSQANTAEYATLNLDSSATLASLLWYQGSSNTVIVSSFSKSSVPRETWTLLSFERDGNTRNFYIDGDNTKTSTLGGAFRPSIGSFYLGNYENDSSFAEFYGYIDNVRLSTTARYSGSDFTVPTTAYTSDSDTLVLLPFDGNNNSTNITGTVNNLSSGSVTAFASATITNGASASFTLDEDAVARAAAGVTIDNGLSASFTLDDVSVSGEVRYKPFGFVKSGVSATFSYSREFGADYPINDEVFDLGFIFSKYSEDNSTMLAAEVQLPSNISAGACIWEYGGNGNPGGAFLGTRIINNVTHLEFRVGNGGSFLTPSDAPGDLALAQTPVSDIPEFDDNIHTLVWYIKPYNGQIILWIDGREVFNVTAEDGFHNNEWGFGDNERGRFGAGWNQVVGPGNVSGDWPGTIPSTLRSYGGPIFDSVPNYDEAPVVDIGAAASVVPDGASATFILDDETARAAGSVTLDNGVSASGSIGTVRYEFGYSVSGVSALVLLEEESLRADANVTEQGLGATGIIDDNYEIEGIATVVILEGVDASFTLDNETVQAEASASPDGVSASFTVDDVTVSVSVDVEADEVSASFTLADETVEAEASVTPTSITLNISLNSVLIWGLIDDAQTGVWADIDNAQSDAWTDIDDAQSDAWVEVSDSQSTSWELVEDGNTVSWTEVET